MSLVSIIIPNYNREHLVGETIRNMIAQTHEPKEIIVVDDGSTDGSLEVLAGFGDQIQVICQENAGPGAARNTGLRAAKGKYVQFMDSDDFALPNKLATQVKILEETGAGIAIGPWVKTRIDGRSVEFTSAVFQARGLPSGDLVRRLASDWAIMLQPCLYRKELAVEVGGVPQQLLSPEDMAFLMKCLLKGVSVVHTPETLVLYRDEHAGQLTGSGMNAKKRDAEFARYLLWIAEQCGKATPPREPLAWFGYRWRLYQFERMVREAGNLELSQELRKLLQKRWAPLDPVFRLYRSILRRMSRRVRLQLFGSPESPAFQMSPVSSFQRTAIEDAGFLLPT